MGLDCSHNAWHGAYSAFMRWRIKLAEVAGMPPLCLMQGFYNSLDNENSLPTLYHGRDTNKPAYNDLPPFFSEIDSLLPVKWEILKPNPLHELLYHSDCDGEIEFNMCNPIADELEKLIPLLPDGDGGGCIGNWRETTIQFVKGLRAAAMKKEPLDFH